MEEQLREYRARKAQEQARQSESRSQAGIWRRMWGTDITSDAATISNDTVTHRLTTPAVNSLQEPAPKNRLLQYLARDSSLLTSLVFLKLALWIVLFALFLHLEFAAVFVIASFFYIIYSTLGAGRTRAPGEPSAYSVFNPNCEQIDGTLTAAQFERELKYGIGSTGK